MKHPYTLSRRRTGLLVIDIQEKFAPAIPGFDALVHNAAKMVFAFQMFKMPILVSEQYPKGLGATVDKIKRQFPTFEPVEKLEFACTDSPAFMAKLVALDLDTVVVVGLETHVCVNQTVLGLIQHGYRVHVVADAVGTRNQLDHRTGLDKMERAGAIPATTEMCLFELAQRAGTPEFKYLQQMIKAAPPKSAASRPEPAAAVVKPRVPEPVPPPPPKVFQPKRPVAPPPSPPPAKEETKSVEVEVEELLSSLPGLPDEETVDLENLGGHGGATEPPENDTRALDLDTEKKKPKK